MTIKSYEMAKEEGRKELVEFAKKFRGTLAPRLTEGVDLLIEQMEVFPSRVVRL